LRKLQNDKGLFDSHGKFHNCPELIWFSMKYVVKHENLRDINIFFYTCPKSYLRDETSLWKNGFFFEVNIVRSIKNGKKFFKQKLYGFKSTSMLWRKKLKKIFLLIIVKQNKFKKCFSSQHWSILDDL